jgi:hypothetical protein
MKGILTGVIKDAPQKKVSKKGNDYYSFSILEGKITRFCFAGDEKLFSFLENTKSGDVVVAKGDVSADHYEKNGIHYANMKLWVEAIRPHSVSQYVGDISSESNEDLPF